MKRRPPRLDAAMPAALAAYDPADWPRETWTSEHSADCPWGPYGAFLEARAAFAARFPDAPMPHVPSPGDEPWSCIEETDAI